MLMRTRQYPRQRPLNLDLTPSLSAWTVGISSGKASDSCCDTNLIISGAATMRATTHPQSEERFVNKLGLLICAATIFLFFAPPEVFAQDNSSSNQNSQQGASGAKDQDDEKPANTTEDLQKATQNPVANLISVPVQNNTNFGIGPFDRNQDVLNIQPVIPFHVSTNWNLIARIIQPVVWQPFPQQTTGGQYGLGDMNPSFFLSPAKPGKIIWGAGPAIVIPTATSPYLGQGKLSLGPSFVALAQPGHWTIGALVNNVWSVAGSGGRPAVNQMLLQYFVNYNMKKGWYITSSPILTANWKATSGNVWTVPFGGGVGRIMKLGFQPVNITAQFYGNAVYPAGTSPWGMRLQIAFLFPQLSKKEKMLLMEEKLKEMKAETAPN